MLSFEVVVADVASNILQGFTVVSVFGHFEFRLDRSKAGFHKRVVVAITFAAHALFHVGSLEHFSIFLSRLLAASIRVMDQSFGWLAVPDRHS